MKYRIIILVLLAAAVVVSIPGLSGLDVTVDMQNFFMENDPVLRNQRKFDELFSNNDFVGVLVECDDVFSRENLELIKRVGQTLKANVPLAGDIVSLAETDNPFMKDDALRFEENVLISSDAEIEKIRELYSGISSLSGSLFTADYSQAWILLSLEQYPSEQEWSGELKPQFAIGKAAYETVEEIDGGDVRLTATGVPVYAYRKEAEMMDDLVRVLIIGFIAALAVSFIIIRNFPGVFGAVLVITASVLSVFGIQGYLGVAVDSAFIAVPILLTTGVSIGYTVHISRFFILRFRQSGDRLNAVLYALKQSGKPILFTAFTTIIALLSFVFIEIRPIRWVGLTSALCIFAVYLLSMSLYPIILSLGCDRKAADKAASKKDWLEPVLLKCADWVTNYRKTILIIFAAAVLITGIGLSRLEVDFNAVKMMGNRLPHMKDQIHIGQSAIATSDTLDLVLSFPDGELKKTETMQKISILEEEILNLPHVKKTTSLCTVISGFNFLKNGWDPEWDKVPEKDGTLRGLLNYFGRLSPDLLYSWVDRGFKNTRVFIELSEFSSKQIEQNINEIELIIAEVFGDGVGFFMSGSTAQMAVMNQYITKGLIKSVLTAMLFISVLMIIVFRSVRLGLVAMIPNIFPVAVSGAVMGFMGMPMEFVTMTVAPMIMGLAVDDTIHLIFHLKRDIATFGEYDFCIRNTFKTVGSAITETTIILCMTFLVFISSRVNSIINMGIISCCGMLAAYLSDIFVTPVIIHWLIFRKSEAAEQAVPCDRK